MHQKPHNILIYDLSYKTLIGAKLLRLRFDKVDGFIRVYGRIKYLVLFGLEKHSTIYDRFKSHIELKSLQFWKNEIDSDNAMP